MGLWRRPARLEAQTPPVTDALKAIVETLPHAAMVVSSGERIEFANEFAVLTGLVRDGKLIGENLVNFTRNCRKDFNKHLDQLDFRRGLSGSGVLELKVSGIHIKSEIPGTVLLLVEDESQTKLIDEVRRDFVANVSHELKTPIGALSILAEAIAEASDDPNAIKKFADRISKESSRLTNLVQEIIDLSRLQTSDPLASPEKILIDQVIREAADREKLKADQQNITLTLPAETSLAVLGSRNQLVTAVSNLINNAIAYSPSHTQIGIGISENENSLEISVIDQGIGIAASEMDRIFERFYRGDPARSRDTGGTGLGLSIVKHIVANHGGTVNVWSQEGSGSTFTIKLPLTRIESALP